MVMMEDLPAELTIDILLRLPVKTIIHCKLVCKTWRNSVSDSSFINLHLSRSPRLNLIIHQNVKLRRVNEYDYDDDDDGFTKEGILKWVEIQDKDHLHTHSLMSLDLNMVPIFQKSRILLKGSVNGLICLRRCSPGHDNTCICNPVTREIIIIPDPPHQGFYAVASAYGFGVASLTGEYKVVRTLHRKIPFSGNKYKVVVEAAVYTIGTGQWRSLGRVPYNLDGSYTGAVLNDHCHWIVSYEENAPENISTFDLNKETFQLFPSPPFEEESDYPFQSLAVLKGCLCKFNGNDSQLTIWVMKEYGIKKSWHKEVVITKEALNLSRRYWYTTLSLFEGLKGGTIFFMSGGLWAFYPTTDTVEEIDTFGCTMSGLTYRPSFLKLENFGLERVHMF